MHRELEHREIKNIMSTRVLTVKKSSSVKSIAKLLKNKDTNCVVVMEKKQAIGIVSETDIVRKLVLKNKDPNKTTAEDIMTQPVVCIPANADFVPTFELMKRKGVKQFPIVDNKNKLIGIITQNDLLNGLVKLVKHLDWKFVGTKISIDECIDKLKDLNIL